MSIKNFAVFMMYLWAVIGVAHLVKGDSANHQTVMFMLCYLVVLVS
jgi:hypothetical protein